MRGCWEARKKKIDRAVLRFSYLKFTLDWYIRFLHNMIVLISIFLSYMIISIIIFSNMMSKLVSRTIFIEKLILNTL